MPDKLKDMFFTEASLNSFGDMLCKQYPVFDKAAFLSLVYDEQWESLELKAKMRHTTLCLRKVLPGSFREALDILMAIAPEVGGFEAMVLPDFVEVYGLEDKDASLPALRHFTRFSSSEFAIRPFLKQDPAGIMGLMSEWAGDENEKVRRLASEGCRPRLPWAMALPMFKKDPALILPILDKLKDDPSETVRRSVANNLNDISKDNPDITLDVCERWVGSTEAADSVVKHACRGLLKAGNKRALLLFGYGDPVNITVQALTLDPAIVRTGENLHFSFQLNMSSGTPSSVRLEYCIDYVKKAGKLSRKVFKITETTFAPGTHSFSRKQSFADMSTRKHHPGMHRIGIIVNGEEKAEAHFTVAQY